MSRPRIFAGVAIVAVGAVASALFTQHVLGMQPCPWCILQRVIFLAIALACVLGLLWRRPPGPRIAAALGLVLALCGVAAALYQHFVAAVSATCNQTFADTVVSGWLGLDSLLPAVFSPRASCADAAAKLMGLPYEFWSLSLFVLMAAAMVAVLVARRQARSTW